jgi:LmbE family N-acetylglucosaminyl deacetylase
MSEGRPGLQPGGQRVLAGAASALSCVRPGCEPLNVVGLGSHPDDIEFGAFGTLAKHVKAGDTVTLLILTRGEQGGNPISREQEARTAADVLKAEIVFGPFQDGYLRDNHKLVNFIQGVLGDARADVVYTHSEKDRHQDHRYASAASVAAARKVDSVYLYETPSTLNGFEPRVYVDVTESIEVKLKALACHHSQEEKRYMEDEAVRGLAKFRAYQGGMHDKLVEAFEVVREVRR